MFNLIKTFMSNAAMKKDLDTKIEAANPALRIEDLDVGQYDAVLVDVYEPRGSGAGQGVTMAFEVNGETRVAYFGIFGSNEVSKGIALRDLASLTGCGTVRDALRKLEPGYKCAITVVQGSKRKFVNYRPA